MCAGQHCCIAQKRPLETRLAAIGVSVEGWPYQLSPELYINFESQNRPRHVASSTDIVRTNMCYNPNS